MCSHTSVYSIRPGRDVLLGHFASPREALAAIAADKDDENGIVMGYSVHDDEGSGEMPAEKAVAYLRERAGIPYGVAAWN